MAALVEEERPVVGSKAAIEISSHLRKQLPPSDFLLEKNLCLKTPTEIYAYKQFIKDRDENICSVGNVDTVQSESVCIIPFPAFSVGPCGWGGKLEPGSLHTSL